MTWTLAVDAVVPGCARTARVASDQPFRGSVRPASHRYARGLVRPASRNYAFGPDRAACRRSACISDRFGSRPCACVPVRFSCFRPASHRRAGGGGPLVPGACTPWAATSSRAGRRPARARPPCPQWAVGAPQPPRLQQPASARRRDVPGVRGSVVTPAEWSFDPGRDV